MRDIRSFLDKSQVILDIVETDLFQIVQRILDVMEDPDETVTRSELNSLIFSNAAQTILAESIQGTISKGGNHYDWEQTWICSPVSVPTLKKRHVGIARLKHSCNLGKNAEEIK